MRTDKDKIILNKIIEWLENKASDDYGSGIDDLIVSLDYNVDIGDCFT